MTTAYISLGGNQGDVPGTFRRALAAMEAWPYLAISAVSSLYRTEPQGDASQSWFYNQAAALACDETATPDRLLQDVQVLEKELGRLRDPARRFGPRTIDLDILLFGDAVVRGDGLIIPHPRMTERAFVLVPLLEIAPDLALPGNGRLDALLARLTYRVDGLLIHQAQPRA